MLAGLKGLVGNLGGRQPFRMWNDNTGQFSARARLQTDRGNAVVLERSDGRFVTVPMNRLSEKDRLYLAGDSETGGDEVFRSRLGDWHYEDPADLWALLVKSTPTWMPLLIAGLVASVGCFLHFTRQSS